MIVMLPLYFERYIEQRVHAYEKGAAEFKRLKGFEPSELQLAAYRIGRFIYYTGMISFVALHFSGIFGATYYANKNNAINERNKQKLEQKIIDTKLVPTGVIPVLQQIPDPINLVFVLSHNGQSDTLKVHLKKNLSPWKSREYERVELKK